MLDLGFSWGKVVVIRCVLGGCGSIDLLDVEVATLSSNEFCKKVQIYESYEVYNHFSLYAALFGL